MYRIYTEDTDAEAIEAILNTYFPEGFTILPARGCWHGDCEDSIVIEVSGVTREQVNKAAEVIKLINKQEAVLVTEIADIPALV